MLCWDVMQDMRTASPAARNPTTTPYHFFSDHHLGHTVSRGHLGIIKFSILEQLIKVGIFWVLLEGILARLGGSFFRASEGNEHSHEPL